jgi:hypothetical protein
VLAQHLRHLVADTVARVERRHRVLEDHGNALAAEPAPARLGEAEERPAAKRDRFGRQAGRARQETHDGERGQALAAARFADDRERLAGGDGEVDAAHGPGRPARHRDLDPEAAHLEERRRRHARPSGAVTSRTASPRRLIAKISATSAAPGIAISQGLKKS